MALLAVVVGMVALDRYMPVPAGQEVAIKAAQTRGRTGTGTGYRG